MDSAVDLGARTAGLIPFWLFLLIALFWVVLIALVARYPPGRWPEMARDLAAVGFLVLGSALFFWRPLFTAAHVPRGGGDLNSFFFTLHAYSADRITSLELPLWSPVLHGGMPHLGNFQAGVLYPPNLIAYFLAQPFTYGTLELMVILHYLIASIGGYLLLRALGANRIGGVAGGLLFAFAGFMVAHLGHYSMISAAAWLPWLFWATLRLAKTGSWGWTAVLAGIVFLTATGGHQQTLLFACVGAGLWWLFVTAVALDVRISGLGSSNPARETGFDRGRLWPRTGLVRLVQFVAGFGLGLAMAAPMILPSLELARRSVRSALSFDQASEFSVQPVALLQLILPTVFGSSPTDHWGAFSSGEIWGYAGVVTLVLAALAVALRRSPERLFFVLLGILSVMYALGPSSPLHGWFYQFVPLFDLVRAPARAYMFLNLALAALAGLAISDLSRSLPHYGLATRRALERATRALVFVVAAVGLIALPLFYTRVLGVDDPPNRPVITVDNLWMLLLYLSLLLVVIWLARARVLSGAALGIVLTTVAVMNLFSTMMAFNPTEQDLVASYREPEIAGFLREEWSQNGPFRIDVQHPGLLPNFGAMRGFHLASGVFDPMQPRAYTTLHNVLAADPSLPGYDMLNVRYRVQAAESEAPDGFQQVFESSAGNQVWEHQSSLPRAWFVSEVADLDRATALNAVQDPSFDPSETVIIGSPPVEPATGATGSVNLARYEPERIVLDVDVDGSGYLIVADGFYPGWMASVDGDAATIHEANAGLRAVAVDENTSRVELRYEPALATLGFIVGFLGVGALLLVVAVSRVLPGLRERDDALGRYARVLSA